VNDLEKLVLENEERARRGQEPVAIHVAPEELARMQRRAQNIARPDQPCPLPQSEKIAGLRFTGRIRSYRDIAADQLYPTWAADGNLYSTYADGTVSGHRVVCTSHPELFYVRDLGVSYTGDWFEPKRQFIASHQIMTRTGNVIIEGDDPFELAFTGLPPCESRSPRFHGYYPAGSLVYNGRWYASRVYYHRWLDEDGMQHEYELGPCGGFRVSSDGGKTWEETPLDDSRPLFPERGRPAGGLPIRLGLPKFIDFGMDMEHSPDGYAYLVGHGTRDPKGVCNWSSGDAVFLARVKPSPQTINDPGSYEFFAGLGGQGRPQWSGDLACIHPIIEWPGHCGIVTMTWHPGLRKLLCLMAVGNPDGSWGCFDGWVAEADHPWGPWSRVDYWRFNNMIYCMSLPSKFIARDANRMALFYNPLWATKQPGAPDDAIDLSDGVPYALHVAEVELVLPDKDPSGH
jgi:hypothetical protein